MLACYWTLNNSYLKKIKSYFKCQDYKSLKYIHGVSYNTMIPCKFHRMHFTDKQNGSIQKYYQIEENLSNVKE